MKITEFADILLFHIFSFLDLKELVKSSEVCHLFYSVSKNIILTNQTKNIMRPDLFFNSLYRLNLDNYEYISSAWKNLLFYVVLDSKKNQNILEKKCPENVIFSLAGLDLIEMDKIDPSVKYLDCPMKIIASKNSISDSLIYLNMTEQLYIPENLNFSGKSLRYLDLSFSDVLNVNLNFSKNLKKVNMMGVSNLVSLKGFGFVEELNIDYCELLDDLTPLKNIKFLSMKYNKVIKKVPPLKTLDEINISHSAVEDLTQLPNLTKVYFKNIENLKLNLKNYNFMEL